MKDIFISIYPNILISTFVNSTDLGKYIIVINCFIPITVPNYLEAFVILPHKLLIVKLNVWPRPVLFEINIFMLS